MELNVGGDYVVVNVYFGYAGAVTEQPFHHGNLRAALLSAAEQTIREHGVDAVSLRDLARRAGVSHGAPRRHFPDRQALLDAMAERGFRTLSRTVERAAAEAGPGHEELFRSVARAYVVFAIDEAALMDLMFTTKNSEPTPELDQAAAEFFTIINGIMSNTLAVRPPLDDPQRLQMLLISTLQGIATLVGSGRLPRELVDQLIDDTTTVFTGRSRKKTGRAFPGKST